MPSVSSGVLPPQPLVGKGVSVPAGRPRFARITHHADGRTCICAPAKINLGLRVFPVRPDGFHDLETWMAALTWHDTISVEDIGPLRLEVQGRPENVPADLEKNLVGRAALALAKHAGIAARGRIVLHKVLPAGGGLGGGSSDAANVLVVLNIVWQLGLETEALLQIAATLGSDVPFFVEGRSALCRGRGEIMSPLRSYYPLYAVLIVPNQGISTKPVFEALDASPPRQNTAPINWCGLASMSAEQLNNALVNDLQPAAFAIGPWLADLHRAAQTAAVQPIHMSGSGSTLFTLCSSGGAASALAQRLTAQLPGGNFVLSARILRHT